MIAFPWSRRDDASSNPKPGRRVWRFIKSRLASIVIYSLVGIFAAIVLGPHMVVNVPSGEIGLLWKRFGGGTELDARQLRNEGLHIILPWDQIFLYNMRIQTVKETYHAISSDGVSLIATVNIRFRLRRDYIPQLHQSIGPSYVSLLGPEVASRMREVISHYTAEQVYSTDRQKIQEDIKDRVIASLGERFLERDGGTPYLVPIRDAGVLYDTLLQDIKLPDEVVAAINRKAEQYYISREYVFRVERERRESERKKIEAEGIRDFQQTVSQGISDSYLRWRGIEATLELARSNNAKIVIIGGGKDGLPIILGNVDQPVIPRAGSAQTDPTLVPALPPSSLAPSSGVMPNMGAPSTESTSPSAGPQGRAMPNMSVPSTEPTAPPAGPPPGRRQSVLPFGFSDVENFVSRFRERPLAGGSEPGAATGK